MTLADGIVKNCHAMQNVANAKSDTSRVFSTSLDFIRWLAAFAVVLTHVRDISAIDYSAISNAGLSLKAFYFVTGFGAEAVIVFFVISGFLVGGGALQAWRQRSYSFSDYFLQRFSRIYVVLLPALVLGLLLDSYGRGHFDGSGIYSRPGLLHTMSLADGFTLNLSFKVFFGNLLQLQTMLVSCLGTNVPLWSLAFEWWYYCLFGMILFVLQDQRAAGVFSRYSGMCALGLMFALLPTKVLLWGIFWCGGVALRLVMTARFRVSPVLGFAIFVGGLALARIWHCHDCGQETISVQFMHDALVAAGCLVGLYSFRNARRFWFGPRALHKTFADFSYSLYVVHFPIMILLVAVAHDVGSITFQRQFGVGLFVYMAVLIGTIYLCAWSFATYTEVNTSAVRNAILKGFQKIATIHLPAQLPDLKRQHSI